MTKLIKPVNIDYIKCFKVYKTERFKTKIKLSQEATNTQRNAL